MELPYKLGDNPIGLYSVFDVFDLKRVIQESGSSVDVHRIKLCCKGGVYSVFLFFWTEGGYLRAFRVIIL